MMSLHEENLFRSKMDEPASLSTCAPGRRSG
jgi:hypothetical protein